MKVSIINAGGNNDYIFGLVSGLSGIPHLEIEIIDSDISIGKLDRFSNVRLLPFIENYGYSVPFSTKIRRLIIYHGRLLSYAFRSESKIWHIQWENKFRFLDRLVLPLLYRVAGKKIVFTAHNVDADARAGRSSWYNRATLSFMYRRMDRIIAHTNSIKLELMESFNVPGEKIAHIMHGINSKPSTHAQTRESARQVLQIPACRKVLLIFGAIDRYKGTDIMIEALDLLRRDHPDIFLVIAGNSTKKAQYLRELNELVGSKGLKNNVRIEARWIEDDEVDTFFLAADCVVLPYRKIFQSGVPFMAYRFGLPVIASRVGGLPEVVVEGETGLTCEPDAASLALAISDYFRSDLFSSLEETKERIKNWANNTFSWHRIGRETYQLYQELEASDCR